MKNAKFNSCQIKFIHSTCQTLKDLKLLIFRYPRSFYHISSLTCRVQPQHMLIYVYHLSHYVPVDLSFTINPYIAYLIIYKDNVSALLSVLVTYIQYNFNLKNAKFS